jgi:hypothetical protein
MPGESTPWQPHFKDFHYPNQSDDNITKDKA